MGESEEANNPQHIPLPRSPLLLSRTESALIVIDVQVKLLEAISGAKRLLANIQKLMEGASILNIPVVGTEQYPKGLGATTPE